MTRRPSFLARLLRRSAPKDRIDRSAPPADPVSPGPRRDTWLVVQQRADEERGLGLAAALGASGHPTAVVAREGAFDPATLGGGVESRPWDMAALRQWTGVDRLRVLLRVVDAETIALARDLGALGARVAYEAGAPEGGLPGPLSYDGQTERALIDGVEDLVGTDTKAARYLSSVSGGGRIVHVVADAQDEAGWSASAAALADLALRPSVTVLLATGQDADETMEAVEAFSAARSDGAYRLAVVAAAQDPASERLDTAEEEGQIALFRSARPGRAAAWNLGLSATRSEYVAFAHTGQRPDGAGWLRPALEALATSREIGAVGLTARVPPRVLGSVPERLGAEALRVGALEAVGLVAPRGVIRRAGGLVESLEDGGLHSIDLSFRIRDLGLELALCPALGLRGGAPRAESSREAEAELRRRWSHRRAYLDAS